MYQQILDSIIETIVDELGIDGSTITESSKITADLDVNSLELLNVIIAIEENLEITFEENRLRKVKTVGDIATYALELKS